MTPPYILEALGVFDIDPCQSDSLQGLLGEWRGRVFLNPPYGPDTQHYLKRLADHGNGIALVFARTETKMFFEYVWQRATAILFLRGRLHFYKDGIRAKGNAGGPSCLIAYGHANAQALLDSKLSGCFLFLSTAVALNE